MAANKFYPFKHITLSDKTFEDVFLLGNTECGGDSNYYRLVFLTRSITTLHDPSLIEFVKKKLGDGVVDLGNNILVNRNLSEYITEICRERCSLRKGKGYVYLTSRTDFETVQTWLTAGSPSGKTSEKGVIAFCANEQDSDSPCLVYYDDGSTDKMQYFWTTSGENWYKLRLGRQCPTCEEKIALHIREDIFQDVTFIQWREWELQVTLRSKQHKINVNVCATFSIEDFLDDIDALLSFQTEFVEIPDKQTWFHQSQIQHILYEDGTGILEIRAVNYSFGASSPEFTVEYLKRFDKFGFRQYTVNTGTMYRLYLNPDWPIKIEEGPTLCVADYKVRLPEGVTTLFLNKILSVQI